MMLSSEEIEKSVVNLQFEAELFSQSVSESSVKLNEIVSSLEKDLERSFEISEDIKSKINALEGACESIYIPKNTYRELILLLEGIDSKTTSLSSAHLKLLNSIRDDTQVDTKKEKAIEINEKYSENVISTPCLYRVKEESFNYVQAGIVVMCFCLLLIEGAKFMLQQ